ncbi:MAG TPA: hypothetical protein VK125_02015 [Bacillota bacterium]|nr:hypothetical protein [Bacillota bacterium]
MKISNNTQPHIWQQHDQVKQKSEQVETRKETNEAAIYEKSSEVEQTHVYNKATIQQLKKEADQTHQQLRQMVENLLKQQGKTFQDISDDDIIKVDEQTRAEANEAISPSGPLGVEATSDRIIAFARAISGGDLYKIDTLKGAIIEGFKQAEKILGELPDISQQTYDAVMEKLDAWENEGK